MFLYSTYTGRVPFIPGAFQDDSDFDLSVLRDNASRGWIGPKDLQTPTMCSALPAWLCLLVVVSLTGARNEGRINVAMSNSKPGGFQAIEFCVGCPNPHYEGSRVLGLGAVHGPVEFRASGEMVYAVPNQVNGGTLLNADDVRGRVLLVDRGVVPLVNKVLIAQAAGAVGVVIADDGSCDDELECGPAGNIRDGGFSKTDPSYQWRDITIPSILITTYDAERFRKMMKLQKKKIPGFDEQWIERRKR